MAKNMTRRAFPRGGVRTRLPLTIYRRASEFSPTDIEGLALWLDASSSDTLYTTDAGPVVAVASPLDIAGCALWLDGADSSAASMTLNGSLVETWKDKSNSGNDVTASGGLRPTLTSNALNSRSVLTFGGSQGLTGNLAASITTNAYSVFVVCKITGGLTNGRVFSTAGAGNDFGSGSVIPCVSNAGTLSAFAGTQGTNASGVTGFASYGVFAGVLSSNLVTNSAGGMSVASAAATLSTAVTRLGVGVAAQGGTGFNTCDIAEIILYPTALTTAQRASVESYLATKWSISGVHAPATASSDPVGYWGDKSGNGRHLTQAISGSRPSLLPTGISSRPCLNFDGTDDNIWRQPGLTSDDLSILLVHQTNTLSGGITYEFTHSGDITNSQATNTLGFGSVAAFQVNASGMPTYMSDITRSFANIDIQGRSGTAGDITANAPFIGTQCVSYSATASAVRKQAWTSGKGMLNSSRFNAGGWSAITLGARRNNQTAGGINSPTVFLNGRIAEVIAYSRYISDTERRRLELYLARKYNVTLTGAPIVSNPDAQDWIDRVYGNAGSVSTETAAAVNQFCDAIDNAAGGSIRDRFFRLNIFAGSNLNACLTPLYLGPTSRGIRYGNTTDTNNAFVGVGTDYAETGASGGLTGNGTTKYLDTGFNVDQLPGAANCHLSSFITGTQDIASARTLVGVLFNGVSDRYRLFLQLAGSSAPNYGIQTELGAANSASVANRTNTNGGLILSSRTSTTLLTLYDDAVSIGTTEASTAEITGASPFFVFARNGPTEFYNGRMVAYSIGAGMTAAQVTAYNTAIQAFQSAMGRV
jgi:hypothetical protein